MLVGMRGLVIYLDIALAVLAFIGVLSTATAASLLGRRREAPEG